MRGWVHIDNFGESLKIYGKGRVVLEYRMEN